MVILFSWGESGDIDLFKPSLCFLTIRSWRDFPSMMVQLGVQHLSGNRNGKSQVLHLRNSTQQLTPENWWLEDSVSFWDCLFLGAILNFRGVALVVSGAFFCLAQEVRWGSKTTFFDGSFVVKGRTCFWLKGFGKYGVSTVLVRLLELCMVGRESWW